MLDFGRLGLKLPECSAEVGTSWSGKTAGLIWHYERPGEAALIPGLE